MKQFQVIGGQYESVWYGESDSFRGAQQIAARHMEYWDNWQGWHKPRIYLDVDCADIESRGRILTPDGIMIRVPKDDAIPMDVTNKKDLLTWRERVLEHEKRARRANA